MTRPMRPLRLSWRISQIKNATSGNTKIAQNISDGMFILMSELEIEWISEWPNSLDN